MQRALGGAGWRLLACWALSSLAWGQPPIAAPEPVAKAGPPADMVAVADAAYAPLDGLAPGSREAQERQRAAVRDLGLPLEAKAAITGIIFRLVPTHKFTMGSPAGEVDRRDDEILHEVTLSKPFYAGKYEVTRGEWERVMGNNPSYFKDAGARVPVETVSWDDCQEFVRKLGLLEGVPAGTYRLLTEAEWEHACRAGSTTALYVGELTIKNMYHGPELDPIAWYGGNSKLPDGRKMAISVKGWGEKQYEFDQATIQEVGLKKANAYGLHDMLGNAWEWCSDWHAAYPTGLLMDPAGPATGQRRVFRGGSWINNATACRAALRGRDKPAHRSLSVGLRVARSLP